MFKWGILLFLAILACAAPLASAAPGQRRHLVYFKGTPQELDVYFIQGRSKGSTVMILGGIQGDEPGGFLSADLYADLALKKGSLIVVPRANFRSIIHFRRGLEGDMNRKFDGVPAGDPEGAVVEVLKSLMAQSDAFLNLHDGSGFYRPVWESEQANPGRYGQCIIADADVYVHQPSGRRIELERQALKVVERVNREISDPRHKFHFFNMFTTREDTRHREQRKSATYYALTVLGIPAFGIETSKNLPDLESKIFQHNLAVNAFLDLFGVEVELPRIVLDKPILGYVVISVNGALTLAAADGQTLLLTPGDTLEVVDVGSNYERGLSVQVLGAGGLNDFRRPLAPRSPTDIVVRKDNAVLGRVHVDFLPEGERGGPPLLVGEGKIRPSHAAGEAAGDIPALAALALQPSLPSGEGVPVGRPLGEIPASPAVARASGTGGIAAFLLEVDGRPMRLAPGEQAAVPLGARLRLVDLESAGGPLPSGVVMNLRGFVPARHVSRNTGEDRGAVADTSADLLPSFSEGGKGEVYAVNAELGRTILASCSLKIMRPVLESVTVRVEGRTRTLRRGSRTHIPPGAAVEVLSATLAGGLAPQNPRFTLGGRPFPSSLPQTLTMRGIALNLAVHEGGHLAGKVTWVPW